MNWPQHIRWGVTDLVAKGDSHDHDEEAKESLQFAKAILVQKQEGECVCNCD